MVISNGSAKKRGRPWGSTKKKDKVVVRKAVRRREQHISGGYPVGTRHQETLIFQPFRGACPPKFGFNPTAFKAPVRTSVATEFNSGEQIYCLIFAPGAQGRAPTFLENFAPCFILRPRANARRWARPLATGEGTCATARTGLRTGFPRISLAQRQRQISRWSCRPLATADNVPSHQAAARTAHR